MPITIGSNIASLTAQRRLSEGTSQLSKTYERLSSGLRINKAADDAAGLAISESLKSDRRVFNQGVRNFNDGISLLNIADGAIEQLSGIVIRLKELAEQSANGTYSSTQRKAIDKEAQALSKEYTRIVHSTKFNGIHLLNGSFGSGVRLQGGFGADGSIFSGIGGAIGDGTFGTALSYQAGSDPFSVESGDFNGDGILDLVTGDENNPSVYVLLGNGGGTFLQAVSYQAGSGTFSVQSGDFNGDGVLDLVSTDYGSDYVKIILGTARDGSSPLLPFNLETLSGARQALPVFDQKIQQLGKQRDQIGAFQSRVQVGINNLQAASENYAAAESRIKDADIADESSKLLRLNILQQAASSVLGQANQQPGLALRLLQN